jgi:hypothetical protein
MRAVGSEPDPVAARQAWAGKQSVQTTAVRAAVVSAGLDPELI